MKQKLSNQNEKRLVYEKPVIEVVLMETEAVICQASGGGFNPGGGNG